MYFDEPQVASAPPDTCDFSGYYINFSTALIVLHRNMVWRGQSNFKRARESLKPIFWLRLRRPNSLG
jgi:hypothetical protein